MAPISKEPQEPPYPLARPSSKLRCNYCGSAATLSKVKGVAKWVCLNYPECNSYVGAHPDGTPCGSLADPQLRRLRGRVHLAFDPLWQSGKLTRPEAYSWLAGRMGMAREYCHVAMFDTDLCHEALEVITSYRRFEDDEF